MKKKRNVFIWLAVFSAFALTGLLVIQVFWLRSDLLIRKTNFERDVTEAGSNVVRKLELIELAGQYEKKKSTLANPEKYQLALDSINRILLMEMHEINTQKELEIFINKFFMYRDLMENSFLPLHNPPVDKRVNETVLDSLILHELDNRNITTEYEYAIFNPFKNKLMMERTGEYTSVLTKPEEVFQFELFPEEIHSNPDFLVLYFPNERQYLVGQMWNFLVISIILMLIIIVAFTYSIRTIFQQRRLSEMKSDFFNNMTHEFKTPVSTISLACEALMDKDIQKSEELISTYINMIGEENRRLGYMAEMILQSVALEKGELKLTKETVDIHEILGDVIKNIGIQVEIKDGSIVKDFNASEPVLEVDKVHMTNVFQNLLDNANKYTPVKPRIVVSTKNTDHGLIIWISDNGIGISKANQKKIFEKLYRVPAGNIHNFKGFGLGLSYVKSIVEKHGGTIRLESEPEKGTTFEIVLPLNHKSN
jgi:two-component system phosphate regulon sensor histidine kinase PhoR